MTKSRFAFLVLAFLFGQVVAGREVSEHARKAVGAIRQLREIGLPEFVEDAPGPAPRVPRLLRILNTELRAMIVEYLNDQNRAHAIPNDEDILDDLRAAGWEE